MQHRGGWVVRCVNNAYITVTTCFQRAVVNFLGLSQPSRERPHSRAFSLPQPSVMLAQCVLSCQWRVPDLLWLLASPLNSFLLLYMIQICLLFRTFLLERWRTGVWSRTGRRPCSTTRALTLPVASSVWLWWSHTSLHTRYVRTCICSEELGGGGGGTTTANSHQV